MDYPFNLTGVLYFPKIKNDLDLRRNKIQLYCNQVFVTDSVENIVPDFLTLLHGVIDSPDIPLNVSRSYLQSDANVKKISKYITKKVSDRLEVIFKEDRKTYEEKWDALKVFINYGMLSEPDFYDKATKFSLLKDTEGKYYTLDEYKELIKDNQTDKDGNLVYLYANDTVKQFTYIEEAKQKGYTVLLMDVQLDTPLVDGYTISHLIQKADDGENAIDAAEAENLSICFESQMPKVERSQFHVEVQPMGKDAQPVVITQSEYMRRMKEMSHLQAGMSFYGEMPDMYTFILNSDHPVVAKINEELKGDVSEKLKPIEAELNELKTRQSVLRDERAKAKDGEFTDEMKQELDKCDTDIATQEQQKKDTIGAYAAQQNKVRHLIDLAMLQNGLLAGKDLNDFIKRSVELL